MLAASTDAAAIATMSAAPALGLAIGDRRKRTLKRIGVAIYMVIFAYTLGTLLAILTLVWTVLDLFAEGIFNKDWFDDNGMFANWIVRWIDWRAELSKFVTTGKGDFAWLP